MHLRNSAFQIKASAGGEKTTLSKNVPSFQRFFYQKGQNTTFNQFLSKILTNKSTRKKIQLVEGTK